MSSLLLKETLELQKWFPLQYLGVGPTKMRLGEKSLNLSVTGQ